LVASGAQVDYLEGREASRARLLSEIGSGAHDILHFAGHGFFEASDPARSGLVCASGDVLRGADLQGVGDLPALVFFNACEAARVRRRGPRTSRQRLFGLRRSSSLAEAVLDGGVANFVGTHWPVGDEAALAFSTRFYDRLLDGEMLWRMAWLVPMAVAATLGWYVWRQAAGLPYEMVRTETFTVLAVCQWFNVLNCQSATRSALRLGIFRNRWLLGGLALSIVLQAAVLYWPPLNLLFRTVPIAPVDLLPIVAVASTVLWAEELRKSLVRWRRRRGDGPR